MEDGWALDIHNGRWAFGRSDRCGFEAYHGGEGVGWVRIGAWISVVDRWSGHAVCGDGGNHWLTDVWWAVYDGEVYRQVDSIGAPGMREQGRIHLHYTTHN